MAEWPVFDGNNAAEVSMIFYDLFNKRKFESLIIKESNVYDRYILQYAKREDAILESDRIQRNLLEFEHDLWSY